MTPADFRSNHPDLLFLDPQHPEALTSYLRKHGLLTPQETVIAAAPAGQGNMNCTVRVRTPSRSLILKQARPWVEKYPQFEAPWDRALREMEFYQRTRTIPAVARAMPELLHADPHARILVLSDLGTGGDLTGLYRGTRLDPSDLDSLAAWLGALHAMPPHAEGESTLANREMRALNHAHIFVIPFRPDLGPDLDRLCPGLREAAQPVLDNPEVRDTALRLGKEIYLADGPTLLHGDFFPGSVVSTSSGPRIIDPEFAFEGRPEFDVAVFVAHLLLAQRPPAEPARFLARYPLAHRLDLPLVRQLAGIEMLRRLLGFAQLPLPDGITPRLRLLAEAQELVLDPQGPGGQRLIPAPLP